MTDPTEFSRLFRKYVDGNASPEETEMFLIMADQPSRSEELERLVDQEMRRQKQEYRLEPGEKEAILNHIYKLSETQSQPVYPLAQRRLWPRIAAAASIIICLSIGGYFILHKQAVKQTAQNQPNDIAPGHDRATLTLSGGKKILLTKGLNGLLAQQGQTQVNVSADHIIYDAKNKTGDPVSYNTLTTARGEQSPYPLVLADGTKVWLNAESSITFPTAFNQKERIVKITGEALFEVAHNEKQPFKVQAANQTIEDIGTQFDVNAYKDESNTRTTLIEGSVKVNNILLKPGEQTNGRQVTPANIAQVIAWKDGKFRFVNDSIQTVMRQLARWYDIDVSYAGTAGSEGFNAKISRNQNISVILSALERTNGVRFKIDGRRVTVIQ